MAIIHDCECRFSLRSGLLLTPRSGNIVHRSLSIVETGDWGMWGILDKRGDGGLASLYKSLTPYSVCLFLLTDHRHHETSNTELL